MERALAEAAKAGARGEVPVGAVITRDGVIIAAAGNQMRQKKDPTGHAEMIAIRAAALHLGNERLAGCDLYVTLEPCTMCAAAISLARIRRLYISSEDEKGGGVINGVRFYDQPTCHHAPEVYSGLCESDARELLVDFFKAKRGD